MTEESGHSSGQHKLRQGHAYTGAGASPKGQRPPHLLSHSYGSLTFPNESGLGRSISMPDKAVSSSVRPHMQLVWAGVVVLTG